MKKPGRCWPISSRNHEPLPRHCERPPGHCHCERPQGHCHCERPQGAKQSPTMLNPTSCHCERPQGAKQSPATLNPTSCHCERPQGAKQSPAPPNSVLSPWTPAEQSLRSKPGIASPQTARLAMTMACAPYDALSLRATAGTLSLRATAGSEAIPSYAQPDTVTLDASGAVPSIETGDCFAANYAARNDNPLMRPRKGS
jgi:hypothetical protein